MLNEYDEIADELASTPSEPAGGGNQYDAIAEELREAQKTDVKGSVYLGAKKDPDRHAKVMGLAQETELPVDVVDRKFNEIMERRKVEANDFDRMIDDTPGLTQFLSDKDNAALAHDDIDSLSKIEKTSRRFAVKSDEPEDNFLKAQGRAFATGTNNLQSSGWHLAAAYGKTNLRQAAENAAAANKRVQELEAMAPDYAKDFDKVMTEEGGDVDRAFKRFIGSYDEIKRNNIKKALKDFAFGGATTVGETIDMLGAAAIRPKGLATTITKNLPQVGPALVTGWAGAKLGATAGATAAAVAGQLGPQVATPEEVVTVPLAAAVGGTAGFVGGTFAGSAPTEIGAQINEELSRRGFDVTNPDDLERAYGDSKLMADIRARSERKGLTTAGIDALFAAVGVGLAAKSANQAVGKAAIQKTFMQRGKEFGVQVGVDAFGEGLSEAGGQVAREQGDLSKVNFGEAVTEGISSIGQSTAQTTLTNSLAKANALRGKYSKDPVQAAEQVVSKTQEAVEVHEQAEALTALGQAAKESRLSARMPEKLKELVLLAHGKDGATDFHFDIDSWDQFWNERGESPAVMAQEILGDQAGRYNEAQMTGQTLAVPIGDYVSKVARTDAHEQLMRYAKTRPEGMTLIEAEQHIAELPGLLEQLAQEAETAQSQTPEVIEKDSIAQVESDMKSQLIATSRFAPKDASVNARIFTAGVSTLAKRAGLDPKANLDAYGLRVRSEGQAVQPRPGPAKVLEDQRLQDPEIFSRPDELAAALESQDRADQLAASLEARLSEMSTPEANPDIGTIITQIPEAIQIAKNLEAVRSVRDQLPREEQIASQAQAQAQAQAEEEERLYQAGATAKNSPVLPFFGLSPLGFYSQLGSEIEKMDFKTIPAKDLAGRLKNLQGIKQDEVEWIGLLDWLKVVDEQKNAPPKFEVVEKETGERDTVELFDSVESAQEWMGNNPDDSREVREVQIDRSGKVTKEQVLEFIKKEGVQVEQTVLAKDFKSDSDDDVATEVNWDEPERDRSYDSYSVESEAEYYTGDYWDDERTAELREELAPDFTDEEGNIDEDGLSEKMEEEKKDRGWKLAEEAVDSDDYHGARYTVEESNTGWKLEGSDEYGWYSPDLDQHFSGNLEEVKVKLVRYMIREGALAGRIADYIRSDDIKWREPEGKLPSDKTLNKKAKEHLEANRERLIEVVKPRNEFRLDREVWTEEEYQSSIEEDALDEARDEVKATYADPSNPKNDVTVRINHDLIEGEIRGNLKNGLVLEMRGETDNGATPVQEFKLQAQSIDDAKAEAIKVLIDNKMISSGTAEQQANPNEPSGRSKWHQYTMPLAENYREVLLRLPQTKTGEKFVYDTHFSQANIISHLRLSDRVDENGKKTLVAEEIQSDWSQQGRERGFKDKEFKKRQEDLVAQIEKLEVELNAASKAVVPLINQADQSILDPARRAYKETEELVRELKEKDGRARQEAKEAYDKWNEADDKRLEARSKFFEQISEIGNLGFDSRSQAHNALIEDLDQDDDKVIAQYDMPPEAAASARALREAKRLEHQADEIRKKASEASDDTSSALNKFQRELSETELNIRKFDTSGGREIRAFRLTDEQIEDDAAFEKWKSNYDFSQAPQLLEAIENYREKARAWDQAKRDREDSSDMVPDTPYKNTETWAALAMKRLIRLAIEEGYDAVAWTPGEIHVDRWGTDSISWVKKDRELTASEDPSENLIVVHDEEGEAVGTGFRSIEEAEEFIRNESKFWLVGSVEQVGGNADGTDIEEMARQRGELLERKGERVTSKDELRKIIASTLNRERNDRSLESLTESVWKQMQEKDSGVKAPRKEGMEFFYDNVLAKKVAPAILKKLDKGAKVTVGKFEMGNDLEARREYTGPEFTVAELAIKKAEAHAATISRQIRDIQVAMDKEGMSFKDAVENHAGDDTAEYLGGKLAPSPKKVQGLWQIVLTDEMKSKATNEGFTLFQSNGPRYGTFTGEHSTLEEVEVIQVPDAVVNAEYHASMAAAREYASNNLREMVVRNTDTKFDVRLPNSSFKEVLSKQHSLASRVALTQLDKLMKNAVYDGPEPVTGRKASDKNYKGFHRFYAPLSFGGKQFLIQIKVAETNRGLMFYHEVGVESERPAGTSGAPIAISDDVRLPAFNEPSKLSMPDLATAINEARKRFNWFQGSESGNRGSIAWKRDRKFDITLFRTANLSTFLHETGHFYLEMMADLASKSQQIKADLEEIQNWWVEKGDHILEVTDKQIAEMPDGDDKAYIQKVRAEIDRLGGVEFVRETARNWRNPTTEAGKFMAIQFHEYLARGYEAYLMEGKAPSEPLREVFQRISQWLTEIYKTIRNLDVELTDDVRSVMDRMLATDEEIAGLYEQSGINPVFAIEDFMSEADYASYIQAVEDAKNAAREQVNARLMRDLQRKQNKEYRDKKESILAKVRESLGSQKLYRAISVLKTGKFPDGSAGPKIKIDRQLVKEMFGKDFIKKLPRSMFANQGGVDANLAAELLGFGSGEEMLRAMAEAPDMETLAQSLTEQTMKEQFPDLFESPELTQETLEAIHNEKRSDLLRMELEHMASENFSTLKKIIRKVARRVPLAKVVRGYAEKTIQARKVEELRPVLFERAERKAANQAADLLVNGEIDLAFESKYKELLNHELFRAAVAARDEVKNSVKKFKRMFKSDAETAKSRDMDIVNVARAVLSMHGLGKSSDTVLASLDQIKRYDPEGFETVSALLGQVLSRPPKPHEEMSYGEFVEMRDAVESLWELAKSVRTMEVSGQKMDREQVKQELIERLQELDTSKPKDYERAKTGWEKIKTGLLGLKAQLRRVEAWADAMDLGDRDGVFKRYIFRPVSDAAVRYREQKKKVLARYRDAVETLAQSGTLTHSKIIASEIGYEFKDKAELLSALLHIGNSSNKRKLLLGYGWATENEDGSIDSSRWDAFVARMIGTTAKPGMLTNADFDYLQAVWDLNESMKPDAQKAHKQLYGHYFAEITAEAIQTPWGEYRGGYMPAVTDPDRTEASALREEKTMFEGQQNSFMFPSTGRGFTKARVEYNAPLLLNLGMVMSHIDKVMRFTYLQPTVTSAAKLVSDKDFRASLARIDSEVARAMLIPWLQRAASQKVTEPGRSMLGDQLFKALRARTGLQAMVLNFANAFQQVTGFTIAAVRVKPRYLRSALWSYTTNRKEVFEAASERSAFLRTRVTESVLEMQGQIEEMLLEPSKFDKLREFGQKHGYVLQSGFQGIVDVVVWTGAYDQSIAEGRSEAEAVADADEAIRMTQGSNQAEDMSRFEVGTPFFRLFTMFYSYFNMQANLLGTEFATTVREMGLKKGAGRLLYVYTMGFMLPAVLSELIVRAMANNLDDDDDDSYLDDSMAVFFGSQVRSLTAMVPGAGHVAQGLINMSNDKRYDDRITVSPAVTTLEGAVRTPESVYQAIVNNGSKAKAAKDTLTTLGLMTGLPLSPLGRPVGYMLDVQDGRARPTGPVDFTRGLVTGKPGERTYQ